MLGTAHQKSKSNIYPSTLNTMDQPDWRHILYQKKLRTSTRVNLLQWRNSDLWYWLCLGKNVLQAAFRGRLLTGLPITLPIEYTGGFTRFITTRSYQFLGCIFRDSDQLAYKNSAEHADDAEEMPNPADSILEWRLLGTFKELISWQRRTDNQLEADQFINENPTTNTPLPLDSNIPPAPPAPNMITLSHKTALFNWMRWLDVGQTVRVNSALKND